MVALAIGAASGSERGEVLGLELRPAHRGRAEPTGQV